MRTVIVLLLLFTSNIAYAYVGPGLGLGVIGAFFGVILAIFLAIVGVIWYPIKRLLKKRGQSTNSANEQLANVSSDQTGTEAGTTSSNGGIKKNGEA